MGSSTVRTTIDTSVEFSLHKWTPAIQETEGGITVGHVVRSECTGHVDYLLFYGVRSTTYGRRSNGWTDVLGDVSNKIKSESLSFPFLL
jgi:hypothetical protein